MIISSGLTRFTAGREAVEMRLKGFGVPYSFYSFENAPHDVWLFQPWLNQIVNKVDAFLQKEAR
jgi:pectinesterase